MTLNIDIKDINGRDIQIGSEVCAYARNHSEVLIDKINGIAVVELDITKPKPIADLPLFIGKVVWNKEQLSLEILIEKMMTDWDPIPSSVQMGGGSYAYELIN